MNTLSRLLFSILAVGALASCGGSGAKSTENDSTAVADDSLTFATAEVRDLALIYQGGAHRIDWTKDQFGPYVTHKFADGKEEWLFDGYLFLEFKDGKGYTLSPGYDKLLARRTEWEWYLDRIFEPGKSLDALDQAISEKKEQLGDPGFRHKIVLTVIVAHKDQKDWGELDGKKLDFSNIEDQKAATKWFIDQLTDRFAKAGYKNLDLYGLYWIDEDMVHTNDFPKQIKSYINDKGLKFVWIPYWNAPGHERWKELGFDIAYQQPNYFFHDDIPYERLDNAIDTALTYGMGMEFECDVRAMTQNDPNWQYRMKDYIDAFEKRGVFENSAIAYYTDNHLFLDMVENPSPENQAIMDRLARFIVDRRSNPKLTK